MNPTVLYLASEDDWLVGYVRDAASGDLPVEIVAADASPKDRVSAVRTADAIIADPNVLLQGLLDAAEKLRFVQLTTCRYETLDLHALEERDVSIAGIGEAMAPSAAEHTIALMAAVAKKAGRSAESDARGHPELTGKTLGIIGLGNVGAEVARRLRHVAREIRYSDVRTAPQGLARSLDLRRDTQDRLLVEADYVTIHVPLTDQTRAGFDLRDLRVMKRDAFFVNASHPDVLDRAGLLTALESGDIAGAGITYRDPELERLDNVVAAPFPPFPAGEVAERAADLVLENVRRFLTGRPPRSPVESITFPGAGDPAFWSSRMTPRQPIDRSVR